MVCTFFGHRDCPSSVSPILCKTILELIEKHNVDTFYVGNSGSFDLIVKSVLRKISLQHPHIRFYVVLAYIPQNNISDSWDDYSETIVPEGIEFSPKRFAISWRNRWILKQSDYVVTYITRNYGGAVTAYSSAIKQGKTVINLADHQT